MRKRQKQAPKFYWFDTGIVRSFAGQLDSDITVHPYDYGKAFESFIVNEVYRLLKYSERQFQLSYLRTKENVEVDLIIERAGLPTILIEIKSSDNIHEAHASRLQNISKDIKNSQSLLVSRDKYDKQFGAVRALHWDKALREIVSF